jgi:hypothetical protein
MHRLADVGGHQPRRDRQSFVAQARDPAGKIAQCQGMGSRHLHDFALPALQVMQMAQHFAQLFDHGPRGDQEQLARRRQLDRRT